MTKAEASHEVDSVLFYFIISRAHRHMQQNMPYFGTCCWPELFLSMPANMLHIPKSTWTVCRKWNQHQSLKFKPDEVKGPGKEEL